MLKRLLPLDDLRAFFGSRSPNQLWAAGLAVGITILLMVGFLNEHRWGYMKPSPKLIYVQNWSADRSEADVRADQAKEMAVRRAEIAKAKAAAKG